MNFLVDAFTIFVFVGLVLAVHHRRGRPVQPSRHFGMGQRPLWVVVVVAVLATCPCSPPISSRRATQYSERRAERQAGARARSVAASWINVADEIASWTH